MKNILITGVTGSVGKELFTILKNEKDINLKIALRKVENNPFKDFETIEFDFEREETFEKALRNTESIFILAPVIENMPAAVGKFLEEIKSNSTVKEIIYLSGLNASTSGKGFDKLHGDTIEILKKLNIPYTIIEPVEYMKNYLSYIQNPKQNNIISLPQEDSKKSLISHKDIAEIIAKVILKSDHKNETIQISGHDYNNFELANIISEITKESIIYNNIKIEDFKNNLHNFGVPEWLIKNLAELNIDIVNGKNIVNNSKTIELLGREPTDFKDFVISEKEKK